MTVWLQALRIWNMDEGTRVPALVLPANACEIRSILTYREMFR